MIFWAKPVGRPMTGLVHNVQMRPQQGLVHWRVRLRAMDGATFALMLVLALVVTGCSSSAGKDHDVADAGVRAASINGPSGRGGELPYWVPKPGVAWQWQLSGELDHSIDVPVYDVDWETRPGVVDEIHRRGRHAICYVSVGTWESFRSDAHAFPEAVRGKPLADYPDERWLDIRRIGLLEKPLRARLDACKRAGFDAVEPDNVDGYANRSGFDLTAADQLRFNRWIADAVHARGMAVALKNDLDQVKELVDDFDFAVNEQCVEYKECSALQPFVDAGKAVLHAEYNVSLERMCEGTPRGFSSIRKHQTLNAHREGCWNRSRT